MITVRYRRRRSRIFLGISVSLVLGVVLLSFLNLSTTMTPAEAEDRVRLVLSRTASQQFMQGLQRTPDGQVGRDQAGEVQQSLRHIKNLEFVSVKVARPIPDYFLKPHRPNHVVRVVFKDGARHTEKRYFWLSYANVDREISVLAWIFSV